jgi:enoyl-CoA hydratase
MSEYETIVVTTTGPVTRLRINRPETLNALNVTVLQEIGRALFEEIEPQTRVVILEGAGDKAFIAGADISEMQKLTPTGAREFARQGQMITKALETLNQVTIAKVQGYALGGGCELAMACDLVIAGKSAKFGQPEVNLGLIPGFGGTQRLARRVGLPVAMDLLLTGRGRSLSGEEAARLGLVSRVVEDQDLENELDKIVKSILKTGPKAVAETKRLAREAYSMSLDAGLNAEANAFAACFGDDEGLEGLSAFLEKRSPEF